LVLVFPHGRIQAEYVAVNGKEIQREHGGHRLTLLEDRASFSTLGAFKTYTKPWGGADPGDSNPIMNEWGRAWVVPSQVQSGPLLAQTFPIPILPLRDNIPTNSSLGVIKGGQPIFSICFKLTRGSRPYL
jgi:hypothetical protein